MNKMGRLLSSPQIHQKFIWIWDNSYRTTSEQQQKTLNFQKGKTISLEWGRAKDKDIERDKGFQDGDLFPRERVVKEANFLRIHKPPYGWGWGELWNLRVKWNSGGSRAKQKMHHRNCCRTALLSREVACESQPAAEAGGGVLRLRHRCQIPGRSLGLAAVRILCAGCFDAVEGVQRKDWVSQSGKKSLSLGY